MNLSGMTETDENIEAYKEKGLISESEREHVLNLFDFILVFKDFSRDKIFNRGKPRNRRTDKRKNRGNNRQRVQ